MTIAKIDMSLPHIYVIAYYILSVTTDHNLLLSIKITITFDDTELLEQGNSMTTKFILSIKFVKFNREKYDYVLCNHHYINK